MFEEKLNKLIESIELQNRTSPDSTKPVKDVDSVNLSFGDLKLLADIFTDVHSEEVKLFADALSGGLKEFSNPELSVKEKTEKETEIIELFERNKNSISYLNSLNRILIVKDYDHQLLEELDLSYHFPVHLNSDNTQRDQYIEKLAEAYAKGNNSDSIQYLLKTENNAFLESLGFIEDVKTAIKKTERERLKKKLQFLDELESFDLPESEMKVAITQSERERLKGLMRKIDTEEVNELKKIRPSASVIPIEKYKFPWKRYAAAASVIGLIAITTVIVYNNKNKLPEIARNNPNTSDTNNTVTGHRKKIDALASNKFDSVEMVLNVRKEGEMGFSVKQEIITARIYRLKEKIQGSPELQKQFDSLSKLNAKYTFKNNNLAVYLTTQDLPELYKINNKYYLKITDILYYIRPSDKPIMLNKATDRNILDRIEKINYQQDNK